MFRKRSARSTRVDEFEEVVVIHPDDADREEAGHVCEVRRPDVQQLLAEVAGGGVDAELEHEERDRDGEDSVAEGLEPGARHRVHRECRSGRTFPRCPGRPASVRRVRVPREHVRDDVADAALPAVPGAVRVRRADGHGRVRDLRVRRDRGALAVRRALGLVGAEAGSRRRARLLGRERAPVPSRRFTGADLRRADPLGPLGGDLHRDGDGGARRPGAGGTTQVREPGRDRGQPRRARARHARGRNPWRRQLLAARAPVSDRRRPRWPGRPRARGDAGVDSRPRAQAAAAATGGAQAGANRLRPGRDRRLRELRGRRSLRFGRAGLPRPGASAWTATRSPAPSSSCSLPRPRWDSSRCRASPIVSHSSTDAC